ncbi:MAG TPA: hypothetical protein ENN88_00660 [Candidatus Coatesbacteria bacterium]|nr:hypothetical protein [Candidatus Coatesbacteria bacterium]
MNPDIPKGPDGEPSNRAVPLAKPSEASYASGKRSFHQGACADEEYQLTFFLEVPLAARGAEGPAALSGEHVLSLPNRA